MEAEVRIVLADDHAVVRKGLRSTIEESPGLKVIAEAGDGEAALVSIGKLMPDIAVLDIDMPKMDGLQVAREVQRQGWKTNIIFLTLHNDEDMFRRAMELGMKGYLLKESALDEIVAGVRAVSDGRMYFSAAMTALLVQKGGVSKPVAEGPMSSLTQTERNILRLIADGKSSKEIGDDLNIHYRTVENHRTNICRKLGIQGAHALLRFALQQKTNS